MNIIFTYYAHIKNYGFNLEKNRGVRADRKFE